METMLVEQMKMLVVQLRVQALKILKSVVMTKREKKFLERMSQKKNVVMIRMLNLQSAQKQTNVTCQNAQK